MGGTLVILGKAYLNATVESVGRKPFWSKKVESIDLCADVNWYRENHISRVKKADLIVKPPTLCVKSI